MSRDGRRAVLQAEAVGVVDSFTFGAPTQTPASVSVRAEWQATGPPARRGSGKAVAATDPAAFLGTFAPARSTADFSGSEFGFSFHSNPGASTDRGFAEMGRERNGAFL